MSLDWTENTKIAIGVLQQAIDQARKDINEMELKLGEAREALDRGDWRAVESAMNWINGFVKPDGKVF